jgi:hypothetical protein
MAAETAAVESESVAIVAPEPTVLVEPAAEEPTAAPTAIPATAVPVAPTDAPLPTAAPVQEEATAELQIDAPDSAESPPADAFEMTPCLICDVDYDTYTGPLTQEEVNGLLLALNDEYHAWAVYDQVLINFGSNTRPFSNIKNSEATHIDMLIPLFDSYGVPIPANPWIGNAPQFDTVAEACQVGVDAEIVNVTLYSLLYASTNREDILSVYEALQWASDNNHLPAFERCASR